MAAPTFIIELRFCLTVHTSVNSVFFVCESENLLELLLTGSDTSGILASEYTVECFGEINISLFHELALKY